MTVQLVLTAIPDSPTILGLYEQDCKDRQLSPETIRRYASITRHFSDYLADRGLSVFQIDKHVIHDYIRKRASEKVDQKTMENELTAISGLYEFLVFEDHIPSNPVPGVRKRYIRRYKEETDVDDESPRRLLSIEQMSLLINSILDTRDKAINLLLAKTGVRRGELIAMDIGDVNWADQSITLKRKQFRKRSNRIVFFDDEAARVLKRWIHQRSKLDSQTPALFIGEHGGRLKRNGVYSMVVKYAERVGLHDPGSARIEDHFSPHCYRHFFTTWLRRGGMDKEKIKVLRGDRRREAIDIYDRIDPEEVKREYLAYVPQLGV